jgi:hypothetical protein
MDLTEWEIDLQWLSQESKLDWQVRYYGVHDSE